MGRIADGLLDDFFTTAYAIIRDTKIIKYNMPLRSLQTVTGPNPYHRDAPDNEFAELTPPQMRALFELTVILRCAKLSIPEETALPKSSIDKFARDFRKHFSIFIKGLRANNIISEEEQNRYDTDKGDFINHIDYSRDPIFKGLFEEQYRSSGTRTRTNKRGYVGFEWSGLSNIVIGPEAWKNIIVKATIKHGLITEEETESKRE